MRASLSLKTAPSKILVITMHYLGDVLLTTPLIHSLRQAYPDAQLDVLVYKNTASMLEGNPDISHIISTPNRPNRIEFFGLVWKLFRQYDLAVVTQTGDRPFLYALIASSFRVAAVPQKVFKDWWKRFFVQRWIEFDNQDTHTVLQHLKLLDLMSVQPFFTLIPPKSINDQKLLEQYPFLTQVEDYVVLHPHPQWTYKQWTLEGWIALGNYLHGLGLRVVLSCGPAQQEMEYVASIQKQLPDNTINLAGQVSLAELAYIITQAKLYIGPDTGITHLAAATGTPVIALFGPTNPVKWAPWPFLYQKRTNPFYKVGSQTVNNVSLIQGMSESNCVPCHLEGCDRHRGSRSQCLDVLTLQKIIDIVAQILEI